MAEAEDYEMVAEEVDALSAAQTEENVTIDVGAAFAKGLSTKALSYAQAMQILARMPTLKVETAPAPQPQAQQQVQVQKHELKKEMVGAAAKLSTISGSAGREFQQQVPVAAKPAVAPQQQQQLVLPTLSLHDQLSELEKIGIGMSEGVFNQEQLKVIAQELKGLLAVAVRENTGGMSIEQRELVLVRDQRVKELLARLNTS